MLCRTLRFSLLCFVAFDVVERYFLKGNSSLETCITSFICTYPFHQHTEITQAHKHARTHTQQVWITGTVIEFAYPLHTGGGSGQLYANVFVQLKQAHSGRWSHSSPLKHTLKRECEVLFSWQTIQRRLWHVYQCSLQVAGVLAWTSWQLTSDQLSEITVKAFALNCNMTRRNRTPLRAQKDRRIKVFQSKCCTVMIESWNAEVNKLL